MKLLIEMGPLVAFFITAEGASVLTDCERIVLLFAALAVFVLTAGAALRAGACVFFAVLGLAEGVMVFAVRGVEASFIGRAQSYYVNHLYHLADLVSGGRPQPEIHASARCVRSCMSAR